MEDTWESSMMMGVGMSDLQLAQQDHPSCSEQGMHHQEANPDIHQELQHHQDAINQNYYAVSQVGSLMLANYGGGLWFGR